ncbi:MAG TPA: hypothetical protein DEQ98_07870 [Acidobacteria bacterium]|jgi:uncharacterized membrane protein|nr:hypothetical protein [Acidobacteriota bacterium]HCE03143.1 hypothetical protein [Acidobacteriota bacterium]
MTGLADWAPNPHALIVHLPIGLLVTAVVVDVLAVVRRDPTTLRLVSTGLHVGGTVMLIVAYLTGRDAAPEVFTPGLAQAVVTRHWDQALWCVWYFGLTTAGRVGLQMRYGRLGRSAAAGLAVVGVGGVLLLATVAELGGRLVYEYGVGVAAPVGDRTLN